MAGVWRDVQAVLPSSQAEFPLQFSETVEPSVLALLERSRNQLYRDQLHSSASSETAQIIIDYSWEKLNTGTWRDVDKDWRRVYSYGCLFKVIGMCSGEDSSQARIQEAIRTCDMGLLMGASIMDNILQRLVALLKHKLKTQLHSVEEDTSDQPCPKVIKSVKK